MITSRTLLPKLAGPSVLAGLALACAEPTRELPNQPVLRFGESVEVALAIRAPNQPDVRLFEIEVEKPGYLELEVREAGLELTLELKTHDGKTLLSTADSPTGRNGKETLRAVVEAPGRYGLLVSGFGERGQTATSKMKWIVFRDAVEADRARVRAWNDALQASLEADGGPEVCQNSRIVREAVAAERVRLREAWHALGDENWAAWAQLELVACRSADGELDLARRDLAHAEELVGRLDNPRLAADLEWQRGLMLDAGGDKRGAVRALERTLELRRRDGDALKEGSTLLELARLHAELLEAQVARDLYDQAIAMRREQGDVLRVARALLLRARFLSDQGDPKLALLDLESAFTLPLDAARVDHLRVLGALHNTRGHALASLGRLQEAIEAYQRSATEHGTVADALREAGRPALQVYCEQRLVLYNLAGVYLGLEDTRKAREVLNQAEGTTVAPSCQWTGLIEASLAELDFRDGQQERAFSRFEAALAHAVEARSEMTLVGIQTSYGSVLRRAGRPREAVALLGRALELPEVQRNPRLQAMLGAELGDAHRQSGDMQRARVVLARAIELISEHPSLDADAKTLVLGRWAELAREEGHLKEAWQRIEKALALDESGRRELSDPNLRALFLGARRYRYELALGILADRQLRDKDAEVAARALEVSELARARVLRDLLAAGTVAPRDEQSIRAAIPADVLLLEYFAGQRKVFLLAVTRDRVRFVPLDISAAGLPDEINAFRRLVQHGGVMSGGEIAQAGHALFRQLLEPVLSELLRARRLVVVADGALFALPFDAVVSSPPRGRWVDLRNVQYLVRTWQFTYVPSASMLVDLREPQRSPSRSATMELLAVANPERLGKVLPPLPASGAEAQEIARLFPSGSARVLEGEYATEALVREQVGSARVLHLATHAIVDEDDATKTGLVLTPPTQPSAGSDNGLLDLAELASLPLSADLVVLSACSTARGEPIRGEGLIGLSRALFLARVGQQVLTLWPVEDEMTRGFMTAFYREYLAGKNDPESALSKVKRAHAEGGALPRAWAPYILMGKVKNVSASEMADAARRTL